MAIGEGTGPPFREVLARMHSAGLWGESCACCLIVLLPGCSRGKTADSSI
jgi:hypothetical protein